MEPVEVWVDVNGYQEIKVYESFFHMDNVEQNLRYVKYAMKDNNKKRTQIMIVTTCHKISLKSIYKMIRARWLIKNSVFNNLKNHCSMNHCFVHGGKVTEAILYLIFIASNIMQLFIKRRLRRTFPTQKELVRILLKGLYFIDYRSGYLFNSS